MNASVKKSDCGDFEETLTGIEILANCDLLFNAEGGPQILPYWSENLLPKIQELIPETPVLDYLCPQHSIKLGDQCHMLKVGKFDFNPADCGLSYTNERGEIVTYFIPQDQFVYNPALCTLTILPAKGQPGMTIQTGVLQSEVMLGIAPECDGCTLRFQYKDKICDVPLPNMFIGCTYNPATNLLTMLHCDGTSKPIQLPKATLECTVLDDGTQVLAFNSGCVGAPTKMFNIPAVKLDIDNLTVVGSQLTFEYGGDGNTSVVTLDICDIVATHCNATITAIYPNGFDYIDNNQETFEVRWVNCCTYHGFSPTVLDPGMPPSVPANNYPNKADGDTVIECHPNGLAFYTCIGGVWASDFIKTFENTRAYHTTDPAPIDPVNPPTNPPADPQYANKKDGDTVLVCYDNGWCAFTCILGVWNRDWCKVDPVIPELPGHQSPDGSVLIVYDPVTNTYNYTVTVPVVPDPTKETFKAGDTLPATAGLILVCLDDDTEVPVGANSVLPANMVGCVQVDETDGTTAYFPPKARTTPPEVWVGQGAPDKDAGFTVWFDPTTCVVKVCDNAGDWREPRSVVCQEEAPSTDKGGADLWYKPSSCCLSVLCEGVWIGVSGTAAAAQPTLLNCPVDGEDPVALARNTQVLTPANVRGTAAWPFTCDMEEEGSRIYKGENGRLHTDPQHKQINGIFGGNPTREFYFFDGTLNPDTDEQYGPVICQKLVNCSKCYNMRIALDYSLDVWTRAAFGPNQTVQVDGEISLDGGATWAIFVDNFMSTLGAHDGQGFVQDHNAISRQLAGLILAPEEEIDVCIRLSTRQQPTNDNADHFFVAGPRLFVTYKGQTLDNCPQEPQTVQ